MQHQFDFPARPFWTHAKPFVMTIFGDPPTCVIAFPECCATCPKPPLDGEFEVSAHIRMTGQSSQRGDP